jgi:hypothetical protein
MRTAPSNTDHEAMKALVRSREILVAVEDEVGSLG